MDAWKCWLHCLQPLSIHRGEDGDPARPPSSHSLYSSVPFILMSSGHQDSLGALSLTSGLAVPILPGSSPRVRGELGEQASEAPVRA